MTTLAVGAADGTDLRRVQLPVNGSATAVVGNGFVTLNWTGFSDANSGLVGHRIAYAATTAADGPELVLVGDVKQGAAELDEAIDRLRIGARVRRVPYQPPSDPPHPEPLSGNNQSTLSVVPGSV